MVHQTNAVTVLRESLWVKEFQTSMNHFSVSEGNSRPI